MAVVAGRNRANRPYFFTDIDGNRVEFPAMGEGIGELDGAELAKFDKLVASKQIEVADAVKPEAVIDPLDHDGDGRKGGSLPKRGRPRKDK